MLKIRNKIIKNILILAEDTFFKIPISILKKKSMTRCTNNKQIVFILEKVSPRPIKIMSELKRNGYEVIAIARYTNTHLFDKQVRQAASKTYFCVSPNKALNICLRYKPICYHIFCCYRYDIAEHIIKNKIGKIVFDNYDGFAGFVYGYNDTVENRKIVEQERYCLENADGLACRSFETQYQKYKMRYQFKGKRILFLDYCDTLNKEYLHNKRQTGNQLKFAYCGGVPDENESNYCFACNGEFAKIITKYNNTYSIYCSNYDERIHNNLIDLENELAGFKFYRPVPFSELKKLMNKFDYGVFTVSQNRLEYVKKNLTDQVYYATKYKYGSANKFFDYLEVGLPIVAKYPTIMFNIFKHYGVAYESTIESIESDLPILWKMLPTLKKNIERNIDKLTMESNIHRLIRFYNNL